MFLHSSKEYENHSMFVCFFFAKMHVFLCPINGPFMSQYSLIFKDSFIFCSKMNNLLIKYSILVVCVCVFRTGGLSLQTLSSSLFIIFNYSHMLVMNCSVSSEQTNKIWPINLSPGKRVDSLFPSTPQSICVLFPSIFRNLLVVVICGVDKFVIVSVKSIYCTQHRIPFTD